MRFRNFIALAAANVSVPAAAEVVGIEIKEQRPWIPGRSFRRLSSCRGAGAGAYDDAAGLGPGCRVERALASPQALGRLPRALKQTSRCASNRRLAAI
jgi:hypothetical protein